MLPKGWGSAISSERVEYTLLPQKCNQPPSAEPSPTAASEGPAWHYPGNVRRVEWARPESTFARQRDTTEAHQLQKTLLCHG